MDRLATCEGASASRHKSGLPSILVVITNRHPSHLRRRPRRQPQLFPLG
jgi:hypothetical protein